MGLRLVERFRELCKEAVEADPLRAVSLVYEEQLSAIKNSLEPGSMEETEFEALVPNFPAMASSLYR